MFKKVLLGLGLVTIGAAIYQYKKEQEFNENIDNITRRTVDDITRNMERMTQETVQRVHQDFVNQMNMM
jgi:hypothetical protein